MNAARATHGLSLKAFLGLVLIVMTLLSGAASLAQKADAQSSPSMTFGVVFNRASYGNPELSYNTPAVETADLNMLMATNAQCIRIDLGYAPWLQNNQVAIQEITSLVQDIKAAGRCLIIADSASESYRSGGQLPWSQFKTAWVSRVSTLAALYHPDYYVVVKEPGWYVPLVSDATTNPLFQNLNDWLGLTQNLTKAVLAASPSTVVGVAIAANSLTQANGAFYSQYLNQVQSISGLSFIGFDVYGQSDQTATQNFLSKNHPSKAVWLPEAWSTATGAPLNGDPSQDSQWMRALYGFATSVNVAVCIPFYTDDFASYSLTGAGAPKDSTQILSLFTMRTPVFTEFQSVVLAAGGSSTTTTSTSSGSSTASSSSATSSTASTPSSLTASTTAQSGGSITSSSASVNTRISGGGKGIGPGVFALIAIFLIAVVAAFLYLRGPWRPGGRDRRVERDPRRDRDR